jgi:phosphoglucosamine mutase
MRTLFGTDGIRAKAGAFPLDDPTMFALGKALAHRFTAAASDGRPRFLLGMDTRESGPQIARALSAGIANAGGISISASHNPFEDNGVKIFGHDGMKIPDSVEEQIEDDLRAIRDENVQVPAMATGDDRELIEKYVEFLVAGVAPNSLKNEKVVLDTGNGAAYRIAPEVFRRAGADVRVINDQPDGRNINENAGALHPEGLAEVVKTQGADRGVAFDGDADRAIFVDELGKIRDGDEIIYLWAQGLLRRGKLRGNTVITTVMSNLGFEKQLKNDGITLGRAQVGDKYVLEMMIERGAILGGEQSGHIIDLLLHTTGDGTHTALVFGELLAEERRRFSRLHTFAPMPQILLNEKVGSKPPLESLPKYQQALKEAEAEMDGNGRILVRYSGTENKVRVMVEGADEAQIRRVSERLRDVLKAEIG